MRRTPNRPLEGLIAAATAQAGCPQGALVTLRREAWRASAETTPRPVQLTALPCAGFSQNPALQALADTLTDGLLAWRWEGLAMPVTSDTKYGTQQHAETEIQGS